VGRHLPAEHLQEPDSDKCVEISTRSSVREMVAPGAYAVLAPLVVGFLVGPRCLMGLLTGERGGLGHV
jgi:K(+)-stimulated pyrophosphate-energized sodium pump